MRTGVAALCLLAGCADDTQSGGTEEGSTTETSGPMPTSTAATTVLPTTDTTEGTPTTDGSTSCCEVHPTSGCDISSVEACVCAESAFCCQFEWDAACVDLAVTTCGGCDVADDTADTGPMDAGTCCDVQGTPGCSNMEIQDCVCQADAFCCKMEWDGMCVDAAVAMCGANCEGPPPGGDCCEANGSPECDDPRITMCTCALDPFCCEEEWDLMCVEASIDCRSGCVIVQGDCCEANGSPGCDDDEIEECTCAQDPFCCDMSWDDKCVGIAASVCRAGCDLPTTGSGSGSDTAGDSETGGTTTGGTTTGGTTAGETSAGTTSTSTTGGSSGGGSSTGASSSGGSSTGSSATGGSSSTTAMG
ncbi:MAG: hypothetical protein AAF721_27915 [Myxococcota bacterium]